MSLSAAIQEAYASAPPAVAELSTVELYHPTWGSPVRLVRDRMALTATLELTAPNNPGATVAFQPFPFDFTLPKKGEGRQELTLKIDNASRLLMDLLEQMDITTQVPIRVIYRPYASTDLTAPAMNPPLKLTLRNITVDPQTFTASCGYADFANRRFPRKLYRVSDFPGLESRV